MKTPDERAENPTEHAQQSATFQWAALKEVRAKYPELKWFFAIPNGGLRDRISASRLKAEGVKSGVFDTFLPVPRRGYPGLFLEFKRPEDREHVRATKQKGKAGELSDDQIRFRDFVASQGYATASAWTFAEAREILIWYLDGR